MLCGVPWHASAHHGDGDTHSHSADTTDLHCAGSALRTPAVPRLSSPPFIVPPQPELAVDVEPAVAVAAPRTVPVESPPRHPLHWQSVLFRI
jgi:hypothetical protein